MKILTFFMFARCSWLTGEGISRKVGVVRGSRHTAESPVANVAGDPLNLKRLKPTEGAHGMQRPGGRSAPFARTFASPLNGSTTTIHHL